jgi:hypothetical protein
MMSSGELAFGCVAGTANVKLVTLGLGHGLQEQPELLGHAGETFDSAVTVDTESTEETAVVRISRDHHAASDCTVAILAANLPEAFSRSDLKRVAGIANSEVCLQVFQRVICGLRA